MEEAANLECQNGFPVFLVGFSGTTGTIVSFASF
jgi:hypothetical protein